MRQLEVRGLWVHECSACHGRFVDNASLRRLEEQAAPPASVAASPPGRVPKGARSSSPVVYIRCPACAEVMNRVQFGRYSGIVVDVCREHGTFFDAEELERARTFIESGGLEMAKRRAADEAAERDRDARARARRTTRKSSTKMPAIQPTTSDDALWAVAHELGRWLRSR
jgi:Zn-finger nucleic acid-binding protein